MQFSTPDPFTDTFLCVLLSPSSLWPFPLCPRDHFLSSSPVFPHSHAYSHLVLQLTIFLLPSWSIRFYSTLPSSLQYAPGLYLKELLKLSWQRSSMKLMFHHTLSLYSQASRDPSLNISLRFMCKVTIIWNWSLFCTRFFKAVMKLNAHHNTVIIASLTQSLGLPSIVEKNFQTLLDTLAGLC